MKNTKVAGTQKGFTLVEMIIVIMLAGIVSSFALPEMSSFVQRSRSQATLTNLQSAMQYARAHALASGSTVTVCPRNEAQNACGNDWSNGWMVFRGSDNPRESSDLLRVSDKLSTDIQILSSATKISFNRLGAMSHGTLVASASGNGTTSFKVCRTNKSAGTCEDDSTLIVEAGGSSMGKRDKT